jgi:hypothetical protein
VTGRAGLVLTLGLLAALSAGVSGCVPGYTRLTVAPASDANHRQPLYMLVRTLDRKLYAGESYADVAAQLTVPDATVLRKELLVPGKSKTLYVKQPKSPLAVYFLFTEPGGTWRIILDPPLPWQLKTELRGSSVLQKSTAF